MLHNNKTNKNGLTHIATITILIAIFVLLIAFFRIPYIGSYIDALFFDFLFGTYKYVIYVYVFVLLLASVIKKTWFRRMTRRRYFVGFIILSFAAMNALTCIEKIVHEGIQTNGFVYHVSTYCSKFWNYCNKTNYADYYNSWFSGGFITEFVYGVLIQAVPVIILIICIIAIIISIAIIFNKKLKFIKKFEAKKVTADLNLVSKEVSEGIVSLPTVEYLTDTSVNNDLKNSSLMDKYLEKIITTLKQHNIEYIKKVITIMPVFSQIQFQFKSENECEEILRLKDKFLLAFHNEKLLILSKGNYVIFEFINKDPSKIGFKQLFKKAGKNKLPIGINLDKKVVCVDFETNQNIFVVGKVGSGTSMIVTNLIISFAYMNNPKESEIVILENNSRAGNLLKTFDELPHIVNKDTVGVEKCKSYIENIIKTKLTKRTLIVFNEFENFVKVSYTNRELIIKLLHFAATNKLCHVVLASKVVDNNSAGDDIYSLFDEKFILKTDTEKESMELLNSPRAHQLCGFGDTFFLDKSNSRERIQTSYISKNELASIIAIINTFFSSLNSKK